MDDDMRELEALLDYLVKHNDDHAAEVDVLAERAQSMGRTEVHRLLTEGVELMRRSNDSLKAALAALRG